MEKTKKLNLIGLVLLLLATLAWGSSFLILKKTIEEVPGFFVISVRFLIAGGIMALIFFKRLKNNFNKKSLVHGVILGVTVALAYLVQTWGLKLTTPSHNAFMTATYCVMCPFLCWIMLKRKPKLHNVISAVLCLVGIGVISFAGNAQHGKNVLLGDIITLGCAIFYSLQIVFIENFQEQGTDPIFLLVAEFFCVGIILGVSWAVFELPYSSISAVTQITAKQWLMIGYLTLACTLFAQMAQIFGQRYTTANQSAIILTMEAVFGTLFSVIFGDEKLTLLIVIGFVLVFLSMMISELGVDFSKLFKRKNKHPQPKQPPNSN